MHSKDKSKLFDNVKPDLRNKRDVFLHTLRRLYVMLDLNKVDLADDDSNDTSEQKGKYVKEDEEKQV